MMGAILVKYQGAVPSNMPRREFNNEILKPSWEATGKYFHSRMLPERFTEKGARLLNYPPRSRAYNERKRKKFGHTRPLVFTGEAEALAKIQDVRATSKGVRIINHARKLQNLINLKRRARMADEVRRIAPSERDELVRVLNREVDKRLKAYKRQSTSRVG